MLLLTVFLESDYVYDVIIFDVDSKDTMQCRDEQPTTSICRQKISYTVPFLSYSFSSVQRKT